MPTPVELVILIGLQGAGKSTFARERFAGHALVSKDLWPNARRPGERQEREARAALAAGRPTLVDNTNPTRADRAALIALAREVGARVVGYYLASVLEECLARNALREGRARVPDVALYDTVKRLERPSRAEGFDALFHVSLVPGGGFSVAEWKEEV